MAAGQQFERQTVAKPRQAAAKPQARQGSLYATLILVRRCTMISAGTWKASETIWTTGRTAMIGLSIPNDLTRSTISSPEPKLCSLGQSCVAFAAAKYPSISLR